MPWKLEALVMLRHLSSSEKPSTSTSLGTPQRLNGLPLNTLSYQLPSKMPSHDIPESGLRAYFAPCQTWSKASNHLFPAFSSWPVTVNWGTAPSHCKNWQSVSLSQGAGSRRNLKYTQTRLPSGHCDKRQSSSTGAHMQFGTRGRQARTLLASRYITITAAEPVASRQNECC